MRVLFEYFSNTNGGTERTFDEMYVWGGGNTRQCQEMAAEWITREILSLLSDNSRKFVTAVEK